MSERELMKPGKGNQSKWLMSYCCPECNEEMKFIFCHDQGLDGSYAYNLYACEICGVLAKQDVWDNEGWCVIPLDSIVYFVDKLEEIIL